MERGNNVTIIRKTIPIDGNVKTNIRWFRHKDRLPRKKKKWMKLQYGPYWKNYAFNNMYFFDNNE